MRWAIKYITRPSSESWVWVSSIVNFTSNLQDKEHRYLFRSLEEAREYRKKRAEHQGLSYKNYKITRITYSKYEELLECLRDEAQNHLDQVKPCVESEMYDSAATYKAIGEAMNDFAKRFSSKKNKS